MYWRRRTKSLRRSKSLLLPKSLTKDLKRLPHNILQLSKSQVSCPRISQQIRYPTQSLLSSLCAISSASHRRSRRLLGSDIIQFQAPHSRSNRNRHRSPILLDQGIQPTISHPNLETTTSTIFSTTSGSPTTTKTIRTTRALSSCCATSPGPSSPVLEFDRRLKVDNAIAHRPLGS